MRKYFFNSIYLLSSILCAQSNTFPSSGNVGIGTTSPQKKLEVSGDILLRNSSGLKQIFTWNPTDNNWRIGMNASPGFTRSMATSHVQFLTYNGSSSQGFAVGVNGGNSSFEIRGSDHAAFFRGNIGLGNNSPTEKLDIDNGSIYGYNSADAFLKIKRRHGQASIKGAYDGASGYDGHVIIEAARTSDAVFLNNYISSNVYLVQGGGKVGIGTTAAPANKLAINGTLGLYGSGLDGSTYQRFVLYSDTQNGLYFDAPKDASGNKLPIEFNWRGGGTTPLRINGDGNVGIGTTSPSQKLDVDGNIAVKGQLALKSTSTSIQVGDLASGDGMRELILRAGDQDRMVIKQGGDIGVGTSTPDEKLTVKGKIHAEEVRVDLSVPGPDYVFKEDYNLPTLASIEKFIKSKKHLPEIPSAKEMETNGVALGTMNMLLLKKIEELTLYLIEQDKINQQLNDRISELENTTK